MIITKYERCHRFFLGVIVDGIGRFDCQTIQEQ